MAEFPIFTPQPEATYQRAAIEQKRKTVEIKSLLAEKDIDPIVRQLHTSDPQDFHHILEILAQTTEADDWNALENNPSLIIAAVQRDPDVALNGPYLSRRYLLEP